LRFAATAPCTDCWMAAPSFCRDCSRPTLSICVKRSGGPRG
jgi:hypothetical protein